jgi:hypothetical protein
MLTNILPVRTCLQVGEGVLYVLLYFWGVLDKDVPCVILDLNVSFGFYF